MLFMSLLELLPYQVELLKRWGGVLLDVCLMLIIS